MSSVTLKYLKGHFEKEAINIKINDLKAEITRNGLTFEQLAVALGISRSSLSRKLRGLTTFTHPEMIKLQKTLNLTGEKMVEIFFTERVS